MARYTTRENGNPPVRLHWPRILTFVGAWIVIIAVGRAVAPSDSRADTSASRSADEGAVVGSLVSRDYIVRITATPAGPRYAVSTLSGQVLQTNLDSKGLAKAFPGLDPASFQATPDSSRGVGALMQADTGEKPQN